MGKPQQPELHRSGHVPALDPDATESLVEAQDVPSEDETVRPVPDGNRRSFAGSTDGSADEDQPDPDAFAESLRIEHDRPGDDRSNPAECSDG